VHRRADLCTPPSDYMRHRVRRSKREWEKIGASVETIQWIREGYRYNSKTTAHPLDSTKEYRYWTLPLPN
jgi:hypothetical protein